ncbi:MAG: hypothetical protein Q8P05_01850 [Candidatus Diapherotrites archaeon]|nr:hypothetical protein [Candidatus Diapherotrites archaeon]MDZ4256440.1 hypothetical protein [archaeon]
MAASHPQQERIEENPSSTPPKSSPLQTYSPSPTPSTTSPPSPTQPINPPPDPNPSVPPLPHSPHRALIIGGILILLILIVGVLVYTKFVSPPTNGVPDDLTMVQVRVVVDDACDFCLQTNTILAKLDESNIRYTTETISLHSPEGKQLVADFDIPYAPTALISVAGLDQNIQIQAALQGRFIRNPFRIVNGFVVAPEQYLTNQAFPVTYTSPPTACSSSPGKIPLRAYLDFGECTPCVEAYLVTQRLETKYPALDVEITPIMFGFPRTPAQAAAAFVSNKGAVCTQEMGFFEDYQECHFFDSQFYGSLDLNRMLACLSDAGGKSQETKSQFQTCVGDADGKAEQRLVVQTKESQAWNPSPWVTPWFVLDCTYAFTGHNAIEAYLCSTHPELEGCTAILDALSMDVNAANDLSEPDTNKSQPLAE